MTHALLTAIFILFAPNLVRADMEQLLKDVKAENRLRICEESYQAMGIAGPKVKIERIKPEMSDKKFPMADSIPGYRPGDSVYIGVANHSNNRIGRHHWYVNIGSEKPVHASRKGSFGAKVISNGKIGINGVLFEIPVPPDVVKRLQERAMAGKFGGQLSCLHAVCNLLEKEGVVINERNGSRKVRVKVVLANLLEGKVKISGKDADPDTIRILTTGEKELSHMLGVGMMADDKAHGNILFYLGVGGGATLVVGGAVAGAAVKHMNAEPAERRPKKYRSLGADPKD